MFKINGNHATTMVLSMSFFCFLAVTTPVEEAQRGTLSVLRFDNITSALTTLTSLAIANSSKTLFIINLGEKMTGISDFYIQYPSDFYGGSKTDKTPMDASWMEYHIVDEGSKWRKWQPASCVHSNKENPPIYVGLKQATKSTVSANDTFNFELGSYTGLAGGYDLIWTNKLLQHHDYNLPARNYGQVWLLQWLFWQDQKSRSCDKYFREDHVIECSTWSEKARGMFPIKNGQVFEWLVGSEYMDFTNCGGGN